MSKSLNKQSEFPQVNEPYPYEDFFPKVLVIDDEPMNILALQGMLKGTGVESDSQPSGVKAVEYLSELI